MPDTGKLVLGFYDTNVGEYDEYNPRYVRDRYGCQEILFVIASSRPYSLTAEDIAAKLSMDHDSVKNMISLLVKIAAISVKNGGYKVNFPAFLKRDMDMLGGFTTKIGQVLGEKIISIMDKIDEKISLMSCYSLYDIRILRYHIIGCSTLDGGAMDYLTERGIITTSKAQPGNRDYLIIGYEGADEVLDSSENLLCSCNIFYTDRAGFCSFGDSNGNRNDMFRFFRRIQSSLADATEQKDTNMAYIKLNSSSNSVIAKKCEALVISSLEKDIYFGQLEAEEKNCAEFLRSLGYIDIDNCNKIKCIVPVFTEEDNRIIKEISDLISSNIFETVKTAINTLDKSLPDLTSIRHGVEFRDIANELWHLMFGAANEYLVDSGMFTAPQYKIGEGRYFQCIYLGRD
jgi:hypothetical protein